MADHLVIPAMPEPSVKDLKETLHAQQELLHQLYRELDVEREASASAASESLSMMLRLQGEKAAVEMEASQYKRIAEEKMFHAQETLEIFRDLIYQKEMQIASLEFQVQAYRFKLISLGCKDVDESATAYPENMLLGKNGMPGGDPSIPNKVRRVYSLPPNFHKVGEDSSKYGVVSGEIGQKVLPEMKEQNLVSPKSGDYTSYWDQIKKLDERVKELSDGKGSSDCGDKLNEMSSPNFLHSQTSSSSFYDASRGEVTAGMMELSRDSAAPAKVLDIFEVPQSPFDGEISYPVRVKEENLSQASEIMAEKTGSIKTMISGVLDKNKWDHKALMFTNTDVTKPRDGLAAEQFSFKRPDVTDFELQQMNRRLKRLEDERIIARKDTAGQGIVAERDEDTMNLLMEIIDHLNSIEDELMSWRPKKLPPKRQADLTPLQEAKTNWLQLTCCGQILEAMFRR